MESKRKDYILDDVIKMQTTKVDSDLINIENYISTENMLPYKGGIKQASGLPEQDKYLQFKKGDILFSNIRTYFRKVWKASFDGGASNDVIVFRTKDEHVLDQSFLYHLLADERFIEFTVTTAKGTKMPRGDKSAMKTYEFSLPIDIKEQKRIAHILGSLDDKIELNWQMNQTLEQMAQALFKSWFIDFDPVIDNALAAGNPIPDELQAKAEQRKALGKDRKALPEEIQRLFPDEFEYSEELEKWIPKGWRVEPLSTFINVKHGYAFKGEFFSAEPTDNILLTPGNVKVGGGFKSDKYKYYKGEIPEDYILKKDDLIITMTDLSKEGDTLGFPAFVPEIKNDVFLHNQRLGKVEFKNTKLNKSFLYYSLCVPRYRHEILGSASGTTVKHTAPSKILAHKILFSNAILLDVFEKQCSSFFSKMQQNEMNNIQLTKLRDTLLPRLISGEVRVPDVEKIIK
ncbi:restriction endonuclease subunit S [Labilibaculum sp.]|uniref:restriction endonuclease subunit S n=1 Tax=Labilibaculum sp. TaxID=2060723 RepID=UPI002AA65598|nr:restriction endonuclease subunit S [Labilibaculum sp.]